MLENRVKTELKKHNLNWDDFLKWMLHQTVSSDENGETIYYDHDVRSFITMKKTGKEPIDFD